MQIVAVIDNKIKEGGKDLVPTLTQAFKSVNGDDRKEQFLIFKRCLEALKEDKLLSDVAKEVQSLLLVEAEVLLPEQLADLITKCLESVRYGNPLDGRTTEIFLRLLAVISAKENVEFETRCLTGLAFMNEVLTKLCSYQWPQSMVLTLVAGFDSLPLTPEQVLTVIQCAIQCFDVIETQDYPALTYQLLLIAKLGWKKEVIEGILKFCNKLDWQLQKQESSEQRSDVELDSPVEDIRSVQGTILVHFSFAIKQDPQLGKELMKYFKAVHQVSVLPPFSIALAISTASNHRFSEQICDLLKSTTLRYFKDQAQCAQSFWLQNVRESDAGDLEKNFFQVIYNSKYSWDQVTKGLVDIGFLLMNSYGPKPLGFGRAADSTPVCDLSQLSPFQRSCKLGADILFTTFKNHEIVRSKILQDLCGSIMAKSNASVSQFTDLLKRMAKIAPHSIGTNQAPLQELFEFMMCLTPSAASSIVEALHPVLTISVPLRDSCILALRKALFSSSPDGRCLAVKGLLVLLGNLRVAGSLSGSQSSQGLLRISSQVQVDVHSQNSQSKGSNEALCLELIGNLRRCFTQQSEVRASLYEGLLEIVSKNCNLAKPALEILVKQLLLYYEERDDVQPPLKLDQCIATEGNSAFITEPLTLLVGVMVRMLFVLIESRQQGNISDGDLMCTQEQAQQADRIVEEIVDSIGKRLITCDLQDFQLDKTSEFGMNTGIGQRNTAVGLLISNLLEIFMEYMFTVGDYDINSCKQVLELFEKHQQLMSFMKEKSSSGKATAKQTKSMFSLRFHTLMNKALFRDKTPSHQESLKYLRENPEFCRYILASTCAQLTYINEKGSCDGPEGRSPQLIYKHLCHLARVYLKILPEQLSKEYNSGDDIHLEIRALMVQCFTSTITTVCRRFYSDVDDFITAIEDTHMTGANNHVRMKEFLKKLQQLCVSALENADNDRHQRDIANALINALGELGRLQDVKHDGDRPSPNLKDWLHQICTEKEFGDTALVRSLVNWLLILTAVQENLGPSLGTLAQDVHCMLGDINKEKQLEARSSFGVVSQKTACPTILQLITAWLLKDLEDTTWLISHCKSVETICEKESEIKSWEELEVQVCRQCIGHVQVLQELTQSAVTGAWEGPIKCTTKFYTNLFELIKLFFLHRETSKKCETPHDLEKLVTLTSSKVTANVYAMITYLQSCQIETIAQVSEKKRKKDKKIDGAAIVGKARVLKESKCIPALIFAIEQYENQLIQLSKYTKANLMSHFRLSTCRDFRIQTDVLMDALADDETGTESQETVDTEDNDQENNDSSNNSEARTNASATQPGQNVSQPATKRRRQGYKKMSDEY